MRVLLILVVLVSVRIPVSFAQTTPAGVGSESLVVPRFDPQVLSQENRRTVGAYEIIWSTTLAEPGSGKPAVFRGSLKNPGEKTGTVFLTAGFINLLGQNGADERWIWSSEEEIALSGRQEIPFELAVHCPDGIYVGIANKVYQGHMTLQTEQQKKEALLLVEEAKKPRKVAPEHILYSTGVRSVDVTNATYAYTAPGHPANRGSFSFSVANTSQQPQRLSIVFGFVFRASGHSMDFWDVRNQHFVTSRIVELKAGQKETIQGEVRSHIRMDLQIDQGRYSACILISPDGGTTDKQYNEPQ